MIDHAGFGVADYATSKSFSAPLAPLGISLLMEPTGRAAFEAPDRATVDAFHAAALEAGGTDNGAPGVREIYHPHYYGAYVVDPDGNNVEAVCHAPA